MITAMDKITAHFRAVDPILYKASLRVGWYEPSPDRSRFAGLCRIIIGQQLSVKAAHSIYSRFIELFPNKRPRPEVVPVLPLESLRRAGLSRAKCAALQDLAHKVIVGDLSLRSLSKLSDEDVVAELTRVRGVGPWSAEMFLIFDLGRADVFSQGDLGLRMAIKKLYGFSELPSREDSESLARIWAPYRSYACRILWRSLDNEPV